MRGVAFFLSPLQQILSAAYQDEDDHPLKVSFF